MRLKLPLLLVFPLLLAAAFVSGQAAPHAPSSTQPADVTAALTAGTALALIEVTAVKEQDQRPADGDLVDIITFKVVKSSGPVPRDIRVIKDFGGEREGPAPKPAGPLYPTPLVSTQRYWIVFNNTDWAKYEQGVVAWWPENVAPVDALNAAINANKFGKAATQP